jgi:hydrogenase maturation protease
MTAARILIAGVGNIFLGDDAFGVEVVRRMAQRPLPGQVRVIDFGIRGIDLAYALLEDYAGAVVVDAVPRGGEPGTLYVLEPELDPSGDPGAGPQAVEAHRLDPVNVFRLARALGGPAPALRIVGCEPGTLDPAEDGRPVLSAAVEAAVEGAITLIEAIVQEWLGREAASCTNSASSRRLLTS